MMKFRKFLTIGIAALTVAAFSFGLAACKPDPEKPDEPDTPGGDTPVTPAEVTVEGGYAYYPPDQGGIGLELNLNEDGTFYYNEFTQNIYYGTYSAEEATGTDSQGRTILYTVTFDENDVFGEETHHIVQDGEDVYLTAMYCDMSGGTYDYTKQEEPFEEAVQTVDQFWSVDFETNFITVAFYSDESYALDGINGAGQAGSLGTYTSETAEDGTVTYTMTDDDDSSKVYTVTVSGSTITLKSGETEYAMTATNPTAKLSMTLTGTYAEMGATLTLSCYDDSTCDLKISIAGYEFSDASGSWSYMASDDIYIVILNGSTFTAESVGTGAYSMTYKINAAQFAGAEVTLTYTPEEPLVKYSFTYSPVMQQAVGQTVEMVCNAAADATEFTFTGSLWGVMTVTLVCSDGGACSAEIDTGVSISPEGEPGTWSIADGVITIEINGTTYTATAAE